MDGLFRLPALDADLFGWRQRTLKAAINCVGIGIHSGQRASLVIRPAESGTGIVFRRIDLGIDIPARFNNVCDTRLCTVLADPNNPAARVGTVEHLMAALAGQGIDNAVIEVDGPEIPILDGSAGPFLFLLDCAGSVEQDAPRCIIEIRRPVRVTAGASYAELRPLAPITRSAPPVLEMDLSIEFDAPAIGRQSCSLRLTPDSFRHQIAEARTFALAPDIAELQTAGFGLGGSLDNVVVVDGESVLNPGGLRMDNEFANHKLLDAVGDMALAGGLLHGRFITHRGGHALNNRLLKALFADAAAWQSVTSEPLTVTAA
jgi:UDP-3-O-[3-hydroxymyristoyl] N-acetylglucosamine deacetylase